MLLLHGLAGKVTEPWVPAEKHRLIVTEARCYLLGYAALFAASVGAGSWAALWLWLLPLVLVLGQWFLRPYLLAEHTGCEHGSDMLRNTRTTYTNAFVRFFAWNMPFHAEHHAYPAVPFHALPRLAALLAAHIVQTEQGYVATSAGVIRPVAGTGRAEVERPSEAIPPAAYTCSIPPRLTPRKGTIHVELRYAHLVG